MGIPRSQLEQPELSRTMRYLGVPSAREAISMGRQAFESSKGEGLAFPAETVIEDPQYMGALGKIGRVAGALQQGAFGALYGALEPEESVWGGLMKGLKGNRLIRFRYFIDKMEEELGVDIPDSAKIGFGWAGDIFLDPIWLLTGPAALTKTGKATRLVSGARRIEKMGEHAVDWATPALAQATAKVGKGAELGATLAEQATKGQRALVSFAGYPVVPRAFSSAVFRGGAAATKRMARTQGVEATLRAFGLTPNPAFNSWMSQGRYKGLFHAREALETQLGLGEVAWRGKITPKEFGYITDVLETPATKRAAMKVTEQSLPVQEFIAKASPVFDEWYKAQREAGVPIAYLGDRARKEAARLRKDLDNLSERAPVATRKLLEKKVAEAEGVVERIPKFLPHIGGKLQKQLRKQGFSAGQLEQSGMFNQRLWNVKYANMLEREMEGSISQINKQMIQMARDQYPELVGKLERRTFWERALRREADPARLEFFQVDPVAITGQYGAAAARAKTASEFLEGAKGWGDSVENAADLVRSGEWMKVAAPELDGMAFPRAIARTLDQHYKALSSEPFVRGVMKIYDNVLSYMRGISLVAPSYHIRNVFGGNLMHGAVHGGTRNPMRYKEGLQFSLHFAGEGWAKNTKGGGGRFLWNRDWSGEAMPLGKMRWDTAIGKINGEQMYKLMRENAVFGEGFMASMIDRGAARAPLLKQNRELGMILENVSRAAHFIDRVVKGDVGFEAGRSVAKYFFNYAELGQLEKQIGRRAVFFYAWPRNNFILHARRLFEYPAVDGKVAQMIAQAQESPIAAPRELVPRWIREQIGVPVKANADGTRSYWMLANWLPEAEIYRLAEMVKEEGRGAGGKIFGSYAAPPIRWAIEKLTNKQLYFDRKIEEFSGESINFLGVPMRKHTAYWLSQLRFLNEIDRINPFNMFGAERYGKASLKTPKEKVLTTLVGRMYTVDERKQLKRQEWDKRDKERNLKRAMRGALKKGDFTLVDKYSKMLSDFYRDEAFL